MQQRYYDPYAGRFLAVDPVATSSGSFNRYWYASNNPYKFTDPDGRLAWFVPIAVYAVGALLHSSPANAPAPGEQGISDSAGDVLAAGLPPAKALAPIKMGVAVNDKMSQRAAAREAKREVGIPTSQQPSSQTNGRASDGTQVGRQQSYEVPTPGGGTETKSVQVSRDTRGAHAGMPQIEAGTVKPGGQTDPAGRPRLENQGKVRVDFVPKR